MPPASHPFSPTTARLAGFLAFLFLGLSPVSATYIGPEAGQKVAFMGDSITWNAFNLTPAGYPQLIEKAMARIGKKIILIPAGVGGNTSKDMLARFDTDVVDKKPDWLSLSCGVNDVLHGSNGGVPLEPYKQNIEAMVAKAQAAGIKVTMLTSTPVGEDPASALNQVQIPYNEFIRSFAKEKQLPLAELNLAVRNAIDQMKKEFPHLQGNTITQDGVHMTGLGDQVMALGILKAWGFTDAQLARAKASWMNLPGAIQVGVQVSLDPGQYVDFYTLANKQGKPEPDLLDEIWKESVQSFLQGAAPPSKP